MTKLTSMNPSSIAFYGAEPEDEAAKVAAAKAEAEAKAAAELAATAAAEKLKTEAEAKVKAEAEAKAAADKKALEDAGNDPEKVKLLKETMQRKEKIAELEAKLKESDEGLKRFEGINPDEVIKLLQDKKDAEKKDLESKGDFERLKKMMAEEHAAELKKITDESSSLKDLVSQANSKIDELTIGNQFESSKFITEKLVLTPAKTRIIYGKHFSMEDGSLVGYDKPDGAKDRTKLVDGSGNPLGFDSAMQKLIEADPDNETMVRSEIKPGSNSNPGAPGIKGKIDDPSEISGMNLIEKALAKKAKE